MFVSALFPGKTVKDKCIYREERETMRQTERGSKRGREREKGREGEKPKVKKKPGHRGLRSTNNNISGADVLEAKPRTRQLLILYSQHDQITRQQI